MCDGAKGLAGSAQTAYIYFHYQKVYFRFVFVEFLSLALIFIIER